MNKNSWNKLPTAAKRAAQIHLLALHGAVDNDENLARSLQRTLRRPCADLAPPWAWP